MSLRSNVVANYLGQGWAALMGVAFVPLYVAVLGIESYALVGVFAILYSALTLMDFGLSATLNREMARMGAGAPHTPESIRDLLRSVEVVCASAAIVAMAVIWAFAPWIATVWLKPEGLLPTVVIDAVRVMSVVLAMRWLEQIYRGALQGLRDYIWLMQSMR